MVLKDVFDQLVLDLHPLHVGDHMDSLLNHEQLDVFLTNEFGLLCHFEQGMHHCY